jgi:dTDP-glucose 4,6-dehydratase
VLGKQDKKVSKKKNALQYMIRQVLKNEDISLYNGGTAYRDYIHVDDVCRAINLVLQKGKVNEIYNVGNGLPVTIFDAISYAIATSGSTSKIKNIKTTEFHKIVQTTNMVLDVSKIKSLGYIPKYDIYDIIDSLIGIENPTK